MKISKLILTGVFFGLSQQIAADSNSLTGGPEVEKEMTALVEAWIDAEVYDDRAALESILHEDFLSTFASGKTLDRSAYIDFIVSMDIAPFSVINESIRQYGDTVVVIDVSESGATKFTWIAIRRDDAWQVISQTFSRVESGQAN